MPGVTEDLGQMELSYIADWNVKITQSHWKTVWQFLKMLSTN